MADFKALKGAVTMPMLLARYGVELRNTNGVQWRGKCPLPCHTSDDMRSFCVNVEMNVWTCKSDTCAKTVPVMKDRPGGDIFQFVAVMEGVTVAEAGNKIAEWFGSPGTPSTSRPNLPISENTYSSEQVNPPLGRTLDPLSYDHPYLTGRGFPPDVCEQLGVGYYPRNGLMKGRVVFPLKDECGVLVGYAGRAVADVPKDQRWRFPAGLKTGLLLWGFIPQARAFTIVCESFWGAMRCFQAGMPAVCTLGKDITAAQIAQLGRFKRIALMLDGDKPGRAAAEKVLPKLARVSYVHDIVIEGQPDELTTQQINALVFDSLK